MGVQQALLMASAGGGGTTNPDAVSLWAKAQRYYPFQETSLAVGQKLTDIIAGNQVTIAGTGSLSSAAGKVGNAITSTGNIYATESTGSFASLSNFGIAFWVKSVGTGTGQYILNNWNGQNFGATSGSSDAAKLRFLLGVGSTQQLTSATSYNDGNWHFVVMQWTSGAPMLIYIDNMTTADATGSNLTGTLAISAGNVTAFAQYGPASYWPGSLEQCYLGGAPTLAERLYLWNGGAGIQGTQFKSDSGH